MDDYSDATERGPVDFFLFGLGFLGFILGAAGLIVSSPVCASLGAVILVLAIWSFAE